MGVIAFEGPAGCGKTHRLMDELAAALRLQPLMPHQFVLALTFMHGSRRRLDARLRGVPGLAGRFEATTLDSFAWRLTQRWRRLAEHLGHRVPGENDFAGTCALAAVLLQKQIVRAWVEMSFPIVVVDEAQDLGPERSAMIAAWAQSGTIFLAFDEFQCLDARMLPIAIETWLRDHCRPTPLTGCRRTDNDELIQAARAVRDGRAVAVDGTSFKVMATPGHVNFAATCLANAITWRRGGNVAVLTPSRVGGFAENAVARVGQGPIGRHHNGPYDIRWEGNDRQELSEMWDQLGIVDGCSIGEALQMLSAHRQLPVVKTLRDWLIRRRSSSNLEIVAAADLLRQLDRVLAQRRHFGGRKDARFAAMTIQQAKNREFDHVIVFWPHRMRDDPEQKRRLLYNAITRAKRSCTVLVQSAEMLQSPPFAS
jgi:UvrD-like helicase C-terminal domain/AAA domain